MKRFLVLFVTVFIFFSGAATAQQETSGVPSLAWSQNLIDQAAQLARDEFLPKAARADGSLMGVESAEDRQKSIIPAEFEKTVVDHAVFWTTVYWCGLNLQQAHFEQLQDKSQWDEKQLIYIATLHGVVATFNTEQLNKTGACPETFKTYFINNYPETKN